MGTYDNSSGNPLNSEMDEGMCIVCGKSPSSDCDCEECPICGSAGCADHVIGCGYHGIVVLPCKACESKCGTEECLESRQKYGRVVIYATEKKKAEEKIPVEMWFDPQKHEHLQAYSELQEKGSWPKGFIQSNVVMTHGWNILLVSKMADCWLSFKLNYVNKCGEEDE